MLKTITVSSAAIDKGQLTAELATATEDNDKPIQMIIGPVTTGGKKRITFAIPTVLIIKAIARYTKPAITIPPQA